MQEISEKKKRIYGIDFLRVIASIFIVLYHYQIFGGYYIHGGLNFAGGKFDFSTMVEFFFLSAGFFEVSAAKCREMKFGKFFIPKAVRLMPQVALSVIAYELFAYINNSLNIEPPLTVSMSGSIITALCLHGIGIFDNPWINGATWFVSVLLLCHIIYFGIVRICNKIRLNRLIPFALMIILGLALKVLKPELPFLNVYTGRGYCMFFFGCILAYLIKKEWTSDAGSPSCYDFKLGIVIEAVLWPVVIGILLSHFFTRDFPMKGLLLYFIVYPGLFVLFGFGSLRKLFRSDLWGKLGNITYDVYVWHGPMIILNGIIMHFMPEMHISYYLTESAFVLFMFLFGAILFRLVDVPINRLMKKE